MGFTENSAEKIMERNGGNLRVRFMWFITFLLCALEFLLQK